MTTGKEMKCGGMGLTASNRTRDLILNWEGSIIRCEVRDGI